MGLGLAGDRRACSGLAVAGLVGFAVLEPRVRAPMVDFDFFRSRTFLGANLVAFIVTFAMLAMFFFTALYMQNFLGYSPLEAGIRFLPATALIIVAAPIAGRLADRIGPRRLMTGGLRGGRRGDLPADPHHRSTAATSCCCPPSC